jgi:protein transport protein SEC24
MLASPLSSSVAWAWQVSHVFRYADLEAVYACMVKSAAMQALKDPLGAVREAVTGQCVDALYQYRLTCASNSPPGQLILPESLKLLPLYTLSLIKSNVSAGARAAPW